MELFVIMHKLKALEGALWEGDYTIAPAEPLAWARTRDVVYFGNQHVGILTLANTDHFERSPNGEVVELQVCYVRDGEGYNPEQVKAALRFRDFLKAKGIAFKEVPSAEEVLAMSVQHAKTAKKKAEDAQALADRLVW